MAHIGLGCRSPLYFSRLGLVNQRKTLLRCLQKPVESASIFLVPEPYADSQPLLSLRMPNDGCVEVDFIEVAASNDGKAGINVSIGFYSVTEPKLKLNGVPGRYLGTPVVPFCLFWGFS